MLGFYSQKAFLSWHPSKAVAVTAAAAAAEHGKEREKGEIFIMIWIAEMVLQRL